MSDITPVTIRGRIQAIRESTFDFDKHPLAPLEAVAAFTREIDRIMREIYRELIDKGGVDDRVCLVALGGYGREEMFPYSDVDILILHDYAHPPEKIGAAVRFFWDTGLTMGCAVRTLKECRAILGEDIATDAAFLEARFVAGGRALFPKLRSRIVAPYFQKHSTGFINEMRAGIREGLFSPQSSFYKIEPSIKNGACGLRDCQRVIWAEEVRCGCRGIQETRRHSAFLSRWGEELRTRYTFLSGARIALHRQCERRADILETVFQPMVARYCGFGTEGAGALMEEYFKTVRAIRGILLSFLETTTPWRRFLRSASILIGGNRPIRGVALYNGILFSVDQSGGEIDDPLWIMNVFYNAILCRASLSTTMCERIGRAAQRLTDEEFKTQPISRIMRSVLAFDGPVGRVFGQMHDTGVLTRLIPPFGELLCKVEYDSYHEYTVDQHILLTLTACDDLLTDPDEDIRGVRAALPRRMLLRLALLMHDIGKALPGDHTVNGSVIAEAVCERLGLDEEETARVRLLVHLHIELHNQSLLREPDEESLRQFARQVGDRENLDMLYLLTIADIRSVGQKTWTAWKAFQLREQYVRTAALLDLGGSAVAPAVHTFSYDADTLPEERATHRRWLTELASGREIVISGEEYRGFERVTVCGRDRIGFFTDITACLTSEGYNILGARVYTMAQGEALDIFSLEPPELPAIPLAKRIDRIQRTWEEIVAGKATADDLIRERLRKYPLQQLRGAEQRRVEVRTDNDASPRHTIIEVDTADNFGLLYRIARCLSANNVNIVSARLTTRIDRAMDVFYVTGIEGAKITDSAMLARVCGELERALRG
jgi:[protein-PII] uridylyltransferase